MYFAYLIPASWDAVWESQKLLISYLPQQSWFVNFLLYVLLAIMLMAIHGSHQIWPIVILIYALYLLQVVNS